MTRAIDVRLLGALGLPASATLDDVVSRLAWLITRAAPKNAELWEELAIAVQALILDTPETIDRAEAASMVVSTLLGDRPGRQREWATELATPSADDALRPFVAFRVAPTLAARGDLQLIGNSERDELIT